MITVTVALADADPPLPVAVMVYVVVWVGETTIEPVAGTAPMPGSMIKESA